MAEDPRPSLTTSKAIFQYLEGRILRGEYRAGDVLPSVRSLANELGVSPATVSVAFRRLSNRGLTYAERGVGTRVRTESLLANPVDRAATSFGNAIDVASGAPDPALLPDLNVYLHRLRVPTVLYDGGAMLPAIREFASALMSDVSGASPAQVMIAGGALDGVSEAAGVRLRSGDRVIVEDPGFAAASSLLRSRALTLVPVPIDDEGFRPDAFADAVASGAEAVLYSPRAQNPYGSALTASRAADLNETLRRAAARGRSIFVIENDHASLVSGVPYHSLIADAESWVSIRSLSKSYGPDLRFSIIAGDELTVDRFRRRQILRRGWISTVMQRLVVELATDPDTEGLISRAAAAYTRRRERLLARLEDLGVAARGRSGLNVMVPVDDEASASNILMAGGWHVQSGQAYRHASQPFIRLTPSALSDEQIDALAEATALAAQSSTPLSR